MMKCKSYFWTTPKVTVKRAIAALIAAHLDHACGKIDAAIAKCRAQIDDLAAYRKSLIYECVTGKREVA